MANTELAVLLPHYNNLEGLELTLFSLVNETVNFTLFLIDDGSTNFETVELLVNKFKTNFNIQLERNPQNLGIVATLNKGLQLILAANTYTHIARIDAGDACVNNRFKKQLEAFKKDASIALVGSWVRFVNMQREPLFTLKPPTSYKKLKNYILVYNTFVHSAVIYTVDIVKKIGFYSSKYPALEDHDYFIKILKKYKATVVQEVLVEYEINPNSISILNRKQQTKSRIKLFLHNYTLGFYSSYGLVRSVITHILPKGVMLFFKKNVFYK